MLCLTTTRKIFADIQVGSPVQFRVTEWGNNFPRYRDFHRKKWTETNRSLEGVCFHQGGKCAIPPRYVCHGTHSETIIDQL